MNKTNLNYTAPEVEIISIETQSCFAQSSGPSSYSISSDKGLGDLSEDLANWD